MNTPTPIDDPAHWRQLAEEARRTADQLADPETKQMMLEIDYFIRRAGQDR
jgi:hypothetical protein